MQQGCFLQFAKAPRVGAVKTRLQPVLTPSRAAAVARTLIARVASALDAAPCGWDVCLVADEPEDPFLRELYAAWGKPERVAQYAEPGDAR